LKNILLLIAFAQASFVCTHAQEPPKKIKILLIDNFAPSYDTSDDMLSTQGESYLQDRLEQVCKDLLVKQLLKISCRRTYTLEIQRSKSYDAVAKGINDHDYVVNSFYRRLSSSYEITCKLYRKGEELINAMTGLVGFDVIEGKIVLKPYAIRPLAFHLAREIYKEILSDPLVEETMVIFPVFNLDAIEGGAFFKKHMQNELKKLEAIDPQIRITDKLDSTTLILEIEMLKVPNETADIYQLYFQLKANGKAVILLDGTMSKGNVEALDKKFQELIETILQKNS
jgi:hypothetical protein